MSVDDVATDEGVGWHRDSKDEGVVSGRAKICEDAGLNTPSGSEFSGADWYSSSEFTEWALKLVLLDLAVMSNSLEYKPP